MRPEETLDPEDWESMRALGHRMVDDMMDYMQSVRERPVWQHAPDQIKAHFAAPLPLDPQPPDEVYEEFLQYVLPYPIGNITPASGAGSWARARSWARWPRLAGRRHEHQHRRPGPSQRQLRRNAGDRLVQRDAGLSRLRPAGC